MTEDSLSELPLWQEFARQARDRRKHPFKLLTDSMRECMEIWEDQRLDEEIRGHVQASTPSNADAVEIVREYRLGILTPGDFLREFAT